MSGEKQHPATPDTPVDVAALQAELAEARRIGAWLYDRAPAGLRRNLGDVSEWPWLLDGQAAVEGTSAAPRTPSADQEHVQAVLRTFAEVQAEGEGVYYAAEYVAATLKLSPDEFDAALANLIARRLVEGGRTFRRPFVERVTDAGMVSAGIPGFEGRGLGPT